MSKLFRSTVAAGLVVALSLAYTAVLSVVASSPAVAAEGTLVASRAWGYNEGKFSVSNDGAAEYALPLWTPPGRNGLQPELGLSYHSKGGNGLLGVGWSLGGASSRITPCPRTVAQDGVREAVRYNGTDVYCLDGNRLRPTGPGTAAQREYRTERSTFARIVSFGASGAVPTSFKVWAKDGKILTYGVQNASTNGQLRAYPLKAGPSVTSPSLVQASTTRVIAAWVLHRVEDRNGNAYTIEWQNAEGGAADLWYADLWPRAIQYAPNRRVEFTYAARPDPIDSFERGIHIRTTQRLTRIRMLAAATGATAQLLRDYQLTYRDDSNDSISGRSLLGSVTECDHNAVCLKPLEFQWSLGSYEFDEIDSGVTDAAISSSTDGRLEVADIDGDGKDDLLYPTPDNRWMGRLGVGNGFFRGPHQIVGSVWATYKQDVNPIDFDRDGKVDVMAEILDPNCDCQAPPGSNLPTEYYLHRSTSGAFPEFTIYEPDPDEEHISFWAPDHRDPAYFLDLDGNGLPDYATPRAIATKTPWSYRLNTGDADDDDRFAPMVHTDHNLGYLFGPTTETSFVRVIDSDGDGRDEVLQLRDGGNTAAYETFGINSAGQKDIKQASINVPVTDAYGTTLYLGDFNGDGLKDTVFPFDGLRAQLNSGNGFGPFVTLPSTTRYVEPAPATTPMFNVGVRIADFNNDGADDVLVLHDGDPDGAGDYQRGMQLYTWRDGGFRRIGLDREAVQLFNGVGFPATDVLDVDANGVLDIIHLADGDPDFLKVLRRQGGEPDQLTGVSVNTVGPRVEIDYTTLANRGVHQPGTTNCQFPLTCPVRGGGVVMMHKLWNGDGTEAAGWNVFYHRYQAARVDLAGRGWLGFEEHTVIDSRAESTTVTTFDNTTHDTGGPAVYPYANVPKATTVTVSPDADTEHQLTTTNKPELRRLSVPGTYTVENKTTTVLEQERPVGATSWATLRIPITNREYDAYGNQTLNKVTNFLGRNVTDRTSFRINDAAWLISQPSRQVKTGCPDTEETDCTTREVTFDQYPNGDLRETIVQPLNAALRLTTVIGRDGFGNVTSETATDAAGNARAMTYGYDGDGLHRTSITRTPEPGATPHVTSSVVHSGLGVTLSSTDPNGVTTAMSYDWFGRLRETNRADGSFEHIDHVLFGAHLISTTSSGGGGTFTELDALGREKTRSVKAFNGGWAATRTTYDQLGRVATVSRPALPGDAVFVTTYAYDRLGRVVRKTDPDGVFTRTDYIGLQTHTYDGKGIHSYTVKDIEGDLVASYEDDPATTAWLTTTFDHGPFGEVTKTTAPDGTSQTMRYDTLGRRTRQSDPSAGVTVSTFNAFGELATDTDATGRTTEYRYDALGRVKAIISPDGTATNTWDTAPNGIGKLTNAKSADGVGTNYRYDPFGRPSLTWWNIEGNKYEIKQTYDEVSRLKTLTYPEIPGVPQTPGVENRLVVGYSYNAAGYLTQVGNVADGAVYWQADARNAAGQLERESHPANGVVTTNVYTAAGLLSRTYTDGPGTTGRLDDLTVGYDANRNVTSRNETVSKRQENYTYDTLNRLSTWRLRHNGTVDNTTTYGYDTLGNLKTETVTGQPDRDDITYGYGEDGAPKHRLTSRNNQRYGYDAAGRQITGPQRTVEYNRAGMPKVLTWGQSGRTEFQYDADGARVVKRDAVQTVTFVPGYLERRQPAGTGGSEIHNLHFIVVDGRTVAQVNRAQAAAGGPITVTRTWYLHADNQGTTNLITRSNGQPPEEDETWLAAMYYDPFGQRVNETGKPLETTKRGGPRTGYTGHEHDEESGLIYMKGRMYDPGLRRFITTDPVVSDPLLSQSHNRYAYVRNNPVTLTDPTGLQGETTYGGFEPSFWEFGNQLAMLLEDEEDEEPIVLDVVDTFGYESAPEMDDDAQTSGVEAVPDATAAETAAEAADDQPVNEPYLEQHTTVSTREEPRGRFEEIPVIFMYAGTAATGAAASDGPAPVGDVGGFLIMAGATGMALRTLLTGATTTATVTETVTEHRPAPLTHITYTMFNAVEGKVYTGRASGYGSPASVLAKRFASGHHMTAKGYGPAVIDQMRVATLSWAGRHADPAFQAIRGREQQLIDQAGGAMSDVRQGRTADPFTLSGNAIRGVSAGNPLGPIYHRQASAQFGEIAPYTGN